MDEPFGALDKELREHADRGKADARQLGDAMISVTHAR
jgi:ABC-type Fe3+/spermidine/putrescine transport system ATPase subunit